jgi:hypothetical protein
MNSRKGNGRHPRSRREGTSRLAGHSSHDGFPMRGLKHIDTLAAIFPDRPIAAQVALITLVAPFTLETSVVVSGYR